MTPAVRLIACCIALMCSCAHVPMKTASSPQTLDAQSLMGTWFIVATNFPRWLDGTRTNPRFVYSNLNRENGTVTCDDLVLSTYDGADERIEGVDTQHPQVSSHFTWRGRGWLAPFKSEWDVAALAPDGSWAVIAFSATLFTPAGVDIISRQPTLDSEAMNQAMKLIADDSTLSTLGANLQRLPLQGTRMPAAAR